VGAFVEPGHPMKGDWMPALTGDVFSHMKF
jgi:hypothetical protein